jgi:Domain of unknown function (DUF4157)
MSRPDNQQLINNGVESDAAQLTDEHALREEKPADEYAALQSGVGNALLAAAAANGSPSNLGTASTLQSGFGNAAVARAFVQRKPEGEAYAGTTESQPQAQASPEAATAPPAPLIVEDDAKTLEPGQMRKSDFLAQLRAGVCNTAAAALADTQWSEEGCPYIDQWFGFYSRQSGSYIERALHKYAPEAAGATTASAYVPIVSRRIGVAVTRWVTTGEISGVPEVPGMGVGATGVMGAVTGAASAVTGAASDLVSGAGEAVSSVGSMFFKRREGGAREADDPQAIQTELGAGQSLDGEVRSRMESAFGESFSGVEVHADADAARLSSDMNARALTVGNHVAFGAGEYQPGTLEGEALIAHELAHVLQQQGGAASGSVAHKGEAGHSGLEEDADRAAVGAVVSTWGGKGKGLANVARNALPTLKSGLRLQRCETKEEKARKAEIKRLGGLQFDEMERKRKELEEKERKEAEEAAKKRGEVNPKIEIHKKLEDVRAEDLKEAKFNRQTTDPWLIDITEADRNDYKTKRAPAAESKVQASIKGTELEPIMKGKTYHFDPITALTKGWYAWQSGDVYNYGMSWVHNVEAPGGAKNVWPNLVHEMGGHHEYGDTYANEIMQIVIDRMPEAERDALMKDRAKGGDKWQDFFDTYIYPETEIYSALRERRYAVPEGGGPAPVYGSIKPDDNITTRLDQMQKVLHPEVAKAILIYLRKRVQASPDILQRDKDHFDVEVGKRFSI